MKAFLFNSLSIVLFFIFLTDSNAQIKQSYDVEPFEELTISGPFDIILEKGNSPRVELSGDDDLIENTTVKLTGRRLEIRLENNRRYGNDRMNIRVVFNQLEDINLGGASNTVSKHIISSKRLDIDVSGASEFEAEIKASELNIDLSGASEVNLTGYADIQYIELSGASDYDARNVESEECRIEGSGASRAVIKVSERLTADLSGASSVGYYGSPQYVNANASGASSVKSRD